MFAKTCEAGLDIFFGLYENSEMIIDLELSAFENKYARFTHEYASFTELSRMFTKICKARLEIAVCANSESIPA